MSVRRLEREGGHYVAYRHWSGDTPGILFCPGFHSDMQGIKALALEAQCRARNQQFTRFDYLGHGQSSGNVETGTIGRWRDDTLAILDRVTRGPQIIVGSSMGGWLMVLAAMARPERVHGLLGIAAAPDMTGQQRKRMGPTQLQSLAERGWCDLPNRYDDGTPYRIHQQFLDEAERHFVLTDSIPLNVPVRLLHGMSDPDVPWERSLLLAQQLEGEDVTLHLVKAGDHRLSTPADLNLLATVLEELLPADR